MSVPITTAYDEVIDFIASGTTPKSIADFQPSEAVKERVFDLIDREKNGELSADEKSELDRYMLLEHLIRFEELKMQN